MPIVQLTENEMQARRNAQARADAVYRVHGSEAPMPVHGESAMDYRRRLLHPMQRHSKDCAAMNLAGLEPVVFKFFEDTVYADAEAAALDPKNVPLGTLKEIRKPDGAGRVISEFVGHPDVTFAPFKIPAQRVRIFDPRGNR